MLDYILFIYPYTWRCVIFFFAIPPQSSLGCLSHQLAGDIPQLGHRFYIYIYTYVYVCVQSDLDIIMTNDGYLYGSILMDLAHHTQGFNRA